MPMMVVKIAAMAVMTRVRAGGDGNIDVHCSGDRGRADRCSDVDGDDDLR